MPRVWEKLYAGIMGAVSADPEKLAGFEKALEVGAKVAAVRVTGRPLPAELAAAWEQVDAAAFANVRKMVGLDQMRIALTGAAPIPRRCSTSSSTSACRCPRSTGSPSAPGR